MGQIGPIEDVEIKLTEAHYHFGNIKINSYSGGTTTLSFEDGPYAEYAEYVYNANDERIKKIKFGNYPVKTYIYDGNGRVLSEYLTNRYGSTSLDYNYLYGNNRRLARIDASGNVDYFHTDYLGSSILIDDNWERFYYPFGRELEASGSGNDYKFTGKQQDSESGLYYYWHRYYDSELGRFISVDPRWDKYPGLTPYQYCANNPLKFVDPSGEQIGLANPISPKKWFTFGFKYSHAFQGSKFAKKFPKDATRIATDEAGTACYNFGDITADASVASAFINPATAIKLATASAVSTGAGAVLKGTSYLLGNDSAGIETLQGLGNVTISISAGSAVKQIASQLKIATNNLNVKQIESIANTIGNAAASVIIKDDNIEVKQNGKTKMTISQNNEEHENNNK